MLSTGVIKTHVAASMHKPDIRRTWLALALGVCVVAVAVVWLLLGVASAQTVNGTISVTSSSATATDTHGDAALIKIREGDSLVINFSIAESGSTATGTFQVQARLPGAGGSSPGRPEPHGHRLGSQRP